MKKLLVQIKAWRLPLTVLALLITSSIVFTVFAVTLDTTAGDSAAAGTLSAARSDENTSDSASNQSDSSDDAVQNNIVPSAKFTAIRKASVAPVGASAGDGFTVTLAVTYEDTVKDNLQNITFFGETYSEDEEGNITYETDKVWAANHQTNIVRHYSGDVTSFKINFKSDTTVALVPSGSTSSYNGLRVYKGTASQSISTYIPSYSALYESSKTSKDAIALVKNTEQSDLIIYVHYSAPTTVSGGYSVTVAPKGEYGPYAADSSSGQYQFYSLQDSYSDTALKYNSSGEAGKTYVRYNANQFLYTRYYKSASTNVKIGFDNSNFSNVSNVLLYYNDDPNKTQLLTDAQKAAFLHESDLGENGIYRNTAYTEFNFLETNQGSSIDFSRNFTFEVTYEKIDIRNVYFNVDVKNNCSNNNDYVRLKSDKVIVQESSTIATTGYYFFSESYLTGYKYAPLILNTADSFTVSLPQEFDLYDNTYAFYKRNADGTKGEKLNCTVSSRAKYSDLVDITVTGIQGDFDILFEANLMHVNPIFRIVNDGLHPGVTAMASTDVNKSPTYTSGPDMRNLSGNYHNPTLYSGGEYTITYTDNSGCSQITGIDFKYTDIDGVAHKEQLTPDANGVYSFTVPYVKNRHEVAIVSNKDYENMLTIHYSQTGYHKAVAEIEKDNFINVNNLGKVRLSGVTTNNRAATDAPVITADAYTNVNGISSSYGNYVDFSQTALITDTRSYYLRAGKEYTITDTYTDYNYERLELTKLTVYQINDDGNYLTDGEGNKLTVQLRDSSGNNINDDEVVSKGSYKFTMPETAVKIVPLYKDYQQCIKNYYVSGRGSVTLEGPDNKSFYGYYSSSYGKTWGSNYRVMDSDTRTYTLTATPLNESYSLNSVKAYVYSESAFVTPSSMTLSLDDDNNLNVENYTEAEGVEITKSETDDNVYTIQFKRGEISAKSIIIYADFGTNSANFAPFKYTVDLPVTTGNLFPSTTLYGKFRDNSEEKVEAVKFGNAYSAKTNTALRTTGDLEILKNSEMTLKMGMDVSGNSDNGRFLHSKFVYTNFTYTVNDATTEEELFTFRYFNEGTTLISGDEDAYNSILVQKPVTTYGYTYNNVTSNADDKLAATMTCKFLIPENGITINLTISDTYVPITVNQYIIGSDGKSSLIASDSDFKVDIEKYVRSTPSSSDRVYGEKFFSNVNVENISDLSNYYSLLNDSDNFCSDYQVTQPSQTRWMLMEYNATGAWVNPTPASGYMVSKIEAKAYNRDGTQLADGTTEYSAGPNPYYARYNTTYGYYNLALGNSNYSYESPNRSQRFVINVYYALETKLTVKQRTESVVSQTDSSSILEKVTVTKYQDADYDAEGSDKIKTTAFMYSGYMTDNYNITTYGKYARLTASGGKNADGYSQLIDDEYTWENTVSVNRGSYIQFAVETKGSNNIRDVKVYKADGTKLSVNRISGNGYPQETTTYQIEEAVVFGDDITIDILYGKEQKLKLKVFRLNDENKAVANNKSYTRTDVTVSGVITTNEGTDPTKMPFREDDGTYTNTFTAESTYSVTSEYNTRLTVTTNIGEGSDYIVAVALAYVEDNNNYPTGTPLNLVPKTLDSNVSSDQKAYNYEVCTMNGLPRDNNVTIYVFLAKTSTLRVAVHTANDAGIYGDGMKTGDEASYINFGSSNTCFNKDPDNNQTLNKTSVEEDYTRNAIITAIEEGNFNTSEVTLTDNPYYRTVQAIQGSEISGFVQLPISGDYVITKITFRYTQSGVEHRLTDNTSANGLYTFTDKLNNNKKYLRYNFKISSTLNTSMENYMVDVYIAPAKTIYSKVTVEGAKNVSGSTGGSAVINGVNNVDSEVAKPFTQIFPQPGTNVNSSIISNSYSAYTGDSPYVKQTKCVRDTELSIVVTPNLNFHISEVSANIGSWDGPEITLEATEPQESTGAVTYTLKSGDDNFRMPALNDIYISVVFAPSKYGTVILDLVYDNLDGEGSKPISDLEDYVITLEGSNNSGIYYNMPVITDNLTEEEGSKLTVTDSANPEHTYNVLANTRVSITIKHKDGIYGHPWYLVTTKSVTYQNGTVATSGTGGSETNTSLSWTVNTEEVDTFHVTLVPVSKISFKQFHNNIYHVNDNNNNPGPDEVLVTYDGANGSRIEGKNDHEIVPKSMFHYEGSMPVWTDTATSPASTYLVVKDSVMTYMVNKKSLLPGYQYSLKLYVDDAEVENAFTLNTAKSNDDYDYLDFNAVIEPDHVYYVDFTFDRVDFINYVEDASANIYAVYTDSTVTSPEQIDIYNPDTYVDMVQVRTTRQSRTVTHRLEKEYADEGGKVFVLIEVYSPREVMYLERADLCDYEGAENNSDFTSILDTLNNNYYFKNVGGFKNYYYWFELNPEDVYSLDNTLHLKLDFERIKNENPSTPSAEPDTPAYITVSQYKRDDNNEYIDANDDDDGTSKLYQRDGDTIYYNGFDVDSMTVPVLGSNGQNDSYATCTAKVKDVLCLDVTPSDAYIISRVELVDVMGTTLTLSAIKKNGATNTYTIYVEKTVLYINVYYSRPRVTISFNNENKTNKVYRGSVYIDDVSASPIISKTEYMNDFYANRGDSKQLIVIPETYTSKSGEEKYYELNAILMGPSRDEMTSIDKKLYMTDEENGTITIYLNNISSDIDIDITLRSELDPETSRLIVSHHIMMGDGYELCDELNHGLVDVTAKNDETDETLNLLDVENEPVEKLTLAGEPSIIGSAFKDSRLYFDVTPPEYYKIAKVEGRYASTDEDNQYTENLYFSKSSGDNGNTIYKLTNLAPDSGVVYVDVYYDFYRYTLNYNYEDRYGAEKTYTTSGSLTLQEVSSFTDTEGNVVLSEDFIMSNAPYESNFAKTFRWGGDSEENAENKINRYVDNATGDFAADVSDVQTDRDVFVKYKTNGDSDAEYITVSVPYGQLVKIAEADGEIEYSASGSLIAADEEYDGKAFSYWKIEKKAKNTKADNTEAEPDEIARCYNSRFNFIAMGNYTLTPVYEGEQTVKNDETSASISLLEYSRNQWTANGEKTDATDRLYVDFETAFRDKGKLINSEDYGDNNPYTCGVVFEVCEKLDEEAAKNFEKEIESINYVTDLDNLKKAISERKSSCDGRTLINCQIDNSKITNKNRIEFFQGFGNTTWLNGETGEYELSNALYVIKVYSYMINKNNPDEVILSEPVYINLYDIATSEYSFTTI